MYYNSSASASAHKLEQLLSSSEVMHKGVRPNIMLVSKEVQSILTALGAVEEAFEALDNEGILFAFNIDLDHSKKFRIQRRQRQAGEDPPELIYISEDGEGYYLGMKNYRGQLKFDSIEANKLITKINEQGFRVKTTP